MKSNKRRDTRPELTLRRIVHAQGLRYRVDFQPVETVRRRVDLAFTRAKVVVFLDGCFWHGCPLHYRAPGANSRYWSEKVDRNRARDAETTSLLIDAGWAVVRIWE